MFTRRFSRKDAKLPRVFLCVFAGEYFLRSEIRNAFEYFRQTLRRGKLGLLPPFPLKKTSRLEKKQKEKRHAA
jgi:hypothetical protein